MTTKTNRINYIELFARQEKQIEKLKKKSDTIFVIVKNTLLEKLPYLQPKVIDTICKTISNRMDKFNKRVQFSERKSLRLTYKVNEPVKLYYSIPEIIKNIERMDVSNYDKNQLYIMCKKLGEYLSCKYRKVYNSYPNKHKRTTFLKNNINKVLYVCVYKLSEYITIRPDDEYFEELIDYIN